MTPSRTSISDDWYARSFDALYPVIYAHRTVEAARDEAIFSMEATQLRGDEHVLDLCCGNGRHLAHLCHKTSCAVGLDFSPHLLDIARDSVGGCAKLVRADMRFQPFHEAFDIVMNFFTSMGYFDTEEENHLVIRGIAESLKDGGRFFIDYLNPEWAESNLQPESVRTEGGYRIEEKRWIDRERQRINKTTLITRNGELEGRNGESVKLYSEPEFLSLLSGYGLEVETTYGDSTGAAMSPDLPRMIVVGRKRAA